MTCQAVCLRASITSTMPSTHDIEVLMAAVIGGTGLAELIRRFRSPVQRDAHQLAARKVDDDANNARFTDARDALKIALESMQKTMESSNAVLQAQINDNTRQTATQKQELSEQKASIHELTIQVESLKDERHALLSQLSTLELVKATESQRADQLTDRVRVLAGEVADLREQVGKKDQQIRSLNSEIRSLKNVA